jgi:hypothetical protein
MLKVEPLIAHDRAILPQELPQPPGAKAPRDVEAHRYPLGAAEAPSAARLPRPVPAAWQPVPKGQLGEERAPRDHQGRAMSGDPLY